MKSIDLLLEAIRVVSDKKDPTEFEKLLDSSESTTFFDLISFHSIQPLFAEAIAKSSIENKSPFSVFLENQQSQAFINLRVAQELHAIIAVFEAKCIEILPYKGVLFTNEIFDNQTLRSSGDVDLLFKKKDIRSVLEILIAEGFEFDLVYKKAGFGNSEIIDSILNSNVIEVTLKKNGIYFDVHWGLHYDFYAYKVDYDSFFENTRKAIFYGKETKLPSVETMFWMIILHNGGKECWFRLKHIVDIKYFMKKYENSLDWGKIILKSKDVKLYNMMLSGIFILKDIFKAELPIELEEELRNFDKRKCDAIYAYWPYGTYWNTLFPRIKYEKVFISLQDEGFSVINYFYRFLKSYSIPISVLNDRFFTFPKQFALLNALSKVFTYLIRKFRA
jgi:Uncharacterised nucleotidyltransferase